MGADRPWIDDSDPHKALAEAEGHYDPPEPAPHPGGGPIHHKEHFSMSTPTIRERAEAAFDRAVRDLHYLGDACPCKRCREVRKDLEDRRALADFALRVTSPEFRERIRQALADDPMDCQPWEEIDGCADAVMALLTSEAP